MFHNLFQNKDPICTSKICDAPQTVVLPLILNSYIKVAMRAQELFKFVFY